MERGLLSLLAESMAELVHHKAPQMSGKQKDRGLNRGVQKESKESLGVTISIHGENWDEVRAGL